MNSQINSKSSGQEGSHIKQVQSEELDDWQKVGNKDQNKDLRILRYLLS